jgi:flagellum-specific peptidoglycan hydrolase FlgJ
VIYKSAWGSFRGHSLFLVNSERYQHLFKLEKADYESWAKGLKQAGYATDPKYAEKLIEIIQTYNLDKI